MASKYHITKGARGWVHQVRPDKLPKATNAKPAQDAAMYDSAYKREVVCQVNICACPIHSKTYELVRRTDRNQWGIRATRNSPIKWLGDHARINAYFSRVQAWHRAACEPKKEPIKEAAKAEKPKIIPILPKLDSITNPYEREWVAAQAAVGIVWKSGHECMKALTPKTEAKAA